MFSSILVLCNLKIHVDFDLIRDDLCWFFNRMGLILCWCMLILWLFHIGVVLIYVDSRWFCFELQWFMFSFIGLY